MTARRLARAGLWALAAAVGLLSAAPARAYVEAPYPLGRLVGESTNILLVRVESVDTEKNLVVYRKVRDIKGTHQGETIKHNIGRGGFHPREWQTIMGWAAVGKTALLFHNGGAGEMCLDNYWYQIYAGDWWRMSHGEPYLLRTFFGKPERLAAAIAQMLTGAEVVVPCLVDGDKPALQLRKGKVQRLKASLKIADYNPQRDFAGWGVEEFAPIADMPGFTHLAPLPCTGPDALGVAATDLDGDGKPDFCLYGAARFSVLHNSDGALNDVPLALTDGARGADWADYDGDGRPDLLLATPAGARLFANFAKGFKDTSACLPLPAYTHFTAAAWIDYDGDKHPDILLADGFRGLRLYRNRTGEPAPEQAPPAGKWYCAGPFDNRGGRGFATVYPPEREIKLSATYGGKDGGKVAWKEGPFTDGRVNSLLDLFGPKGQEESVAYLYREIDIGGEGELPVSLGSDDTLTVWLNGERLLAENTARSCAPDQHTLNLKLKAGRNALLLKVCQTTGEFAFYFSAKGIPVARALPLLFEDVSDKVGLGAAGAAGDRSGDHLAIADVNADGRPDILYSAVGPKGPVVILNTPKGFVEAKDAGITYQAGGIAPAFGDFDGDKLPDLFVPQGVTCKLYRNDGKGHFSDVAARAGDLSRPIGRATCAVWADFNNTGRQDLLVGCLRGPNRFYANSGNATFTDATEELGLHRRIFNTRGLAVADVNKDGVPDVVLNNEGQESAVLLGNPDRLGNRQAKAK